MGEPTYVKMRSADGIALGVYIAFGFFVASIPLWLLACVAWSILGQF